MHLLLSLHFKPTGLWCINNDYTHTLTLSAELGSVDRAISKITIHAKRTEKEKTV